MEKECRILQEDEVSMQMCLVIRYLRMPLGYPRIQSTEGEVRMEVWRYSSHPESGETVQGLWERGSVGPEQR